LYTTSLFYSSLTRFTQGGYTFASYPRPSTPMSIDELLTTLFDGQPHLLAQPMATWLTSSRRFTAFVSTYHTKIRKKIRVVQGPENLRDLRLELETAYLLLRERSLNVEYEPQSKEHGRSPDFAVSFTTSFVFMVEVTRLRSTNVTPNIPLLHDRFTDMLCSKLGQLIPQRGNLLLIGMETLPMTHHDIQTTLLRMQKRAEGNDPSIVQRHGFRDRADFFHHYHLLSSILVRGMPLQANEPVLLWDNPQAKYPLPAKVRTALSRSHTM
jgi:hypothetical protein